MKFIKEMYHRKNLNLNGKVITRNAVRAVIMEEDQILMIHSKRYGDYKFPGGGMENHETHEDTLIREVKEECGSLVSVIEKEIGKVIEYDKPLEKEYDLFKMTSYYYKCRIKENYCKLNLDQYEKNLGFKPVWIPIVEAIHNNKLLVESNNPNEPSWITRDTFVLEYIKDQLL